MPRWNNNLHDNCVDVLENVIKNLEPKLFQIMLSEVLGSNIANNKREIEKYVRAKLTLFSSHARHTKQYWILRGWTVNEAYVKSKENKQKNTSSVFSREYWLKKINPVTNQYYTITEADYERNSRRPIRKEYWIKRGYNESDAVRKSKETKFSNNQKGAVQSANSKVRRISSKRCIEFYTTRGYSNAEACLLVSEGQRYFSKKICIEKFGKEKGLKVWQDRQDRWQATLKSKPPEEIARINRLKLTKGITVSKAEYEILSEVKKVNPNLEVSHQYTLLDNNKKQYIYDIRVNNKIIEYNGDFWHCNPEKYSPNFVNPRTKLTALDTWMKDQEKINFATNQGYEVLVVWENDFKQNKKETLKKCIQFLTQ